MQNTQEKRRCSILKKRRSRSMSPNSPQREHTARRASRRISFSGKHNVREFFTNENTAIVWGETYDVSTEKYVLSNEQITLQSTRSSSMSSTLQNTRNDSVSMDISSVAFVNDKKPSANTRPSMLRQPQSYSEDQKENMMINSDSDIQLSLVMQPPTQPAPAKSLFSTSSLSSSSSVRPTMFSFLHKTEASETLGHAEKTSGSDNMDISGVEPTITNIEPQTQSRNDYNYRNWLKQNNLIAKPKADNSRRQTVNQVVDIALDKSQISETTPAVQPMKLPQISNSRKTINEPQEMSLDLENATESNTQARATAPVEMKNLANRRRTVNHEQDMQLEMSTMTESPIVHHNYAWKLPVQSNKRMTINETIEISPDSPDDTNCAQLTDMSIEFLPSEVQNNRRQTINQAKDISLDTSTMQRMDPPDANQTSDMSLDVIQWSNSPQVQRGQLGLKKPMQRMTINDPREMSFDSTTKSATKTFNNKTILADLSMDLQTIEAHPLRKTVICKSPSKNATKLFDQSDSFELTRGVDPNSMYFSFHPLHSTKLIDVNCSKFTEMDFDASIQVDKIDNQTIRDGSLIDETFVGLQKIDHPTPIPVRKVQLFDQTQSHTIRDACDLDISEDSPMPTAKKYNLNKTPFYFGIDKENDPALIETMHASGSSLDMTNTSREERSHGSSQKQEVPEAHRKTELYHTTIQNDTRMGAVNEMSAIEISDSSIESPYQPPINIMVNTRRKTCVQEMSMAVESPPVIDQKGSTNIMTQSILQITPLKCDDSTDDQFPKRNNNRLTIVNNETIAIDSPGDYRRISNGLEESKQLTFIEDDDEDDQICNTKLDLASSTEISEIADYIDRKCTSITSKSFNMSRYSMPSEISLTRMRSEPTYHEEEPSVLTEEIPEEVKLNELNAFKKSKRLRHSNAFDMNRTTETSLNESIEKESIFMDSITKESTSQMELFVKEEAPIGNISMAPVSRSSILQRRNSIGINNDANETSFLSKSVADKPLSEIKLDFSGYDKLAGLATLQDVFRDFCNRTEQTNRRVQNWKEEREKLARGEIDSLESLENNNDEELASLNIEAPSWTFLYKNKMKWEDEQQDAELDRQWEERLVGAHLPANPDISILMLNKCRTLKNWTFDDIWFFQGNVHLRNKEMPVFKVCLIYDPDAVENNVEMYGALKFTKINRQFCRIHLSKRDYAVFQLEVQELKSHLPSNLLQFCETSAYLSDFDEKLHDYCIKIKNKVEQLHNICRKTNALIKEENGSIYIMKTMLDFDRQIYQDYIIELSDVDRTEWRNVRTNPRRVLNEEIKSLPKGLPFIQELLINDSKYVPWE